MARTASTMAGVSFSASVPSSFVDSEVRATESSNSRSTSFCSLNSSRNYKGNQPKIRHPSLQTQMDTFKVSAFAIS